MTKPNAKAILSMPEDDDTRTDHRAARIARRLDRPLPKIDARHPRIKASRLIAYNTNRRTKAWE